LILLLVLGCAHPAPPVAAAAEPPPPAVVLPARPAPIPGALWNEVEARALIGMDGNARRVGDLITVKVSDTSSTSLGADTQSTRATSSEYGIDAALGLEASVTAANPNMGGKIALGGSANSSLAGSGTTSRTGTLAATLTCEVIEVLPTGNLRIRGTKEIKVNRETQYLTLVGVVRPRDILIDNTVASDLIADAHIEFTGAGVLASKQGQGWGTQIADTVWPF